MRDTFIDPNTGFEYVWDIGHEAEGSVGKTRQITHSANTANTGLVRQQGDVGPLVLKYEGKILHLKQYDEMWRFYELCETQTIIYRDYFGEEFEVLITDFEPQRFPTVKNPRDFKNMPLHYFKYSLTMEVISVKAGHLAGLSP